VPWILPGETVAAAAKLMAFHNLGMLPVCSGNGKPVGVITDRDIALRVIGNDRLAAQTVVEDVMTSPAQSVRPDWSVDRIGELMTKAGVSRLLVVDIGGHIEGVISIADLVVHVPSHNALATARGIYARETSRDHSTGRPHLAAKPDPQYFRGARDIASNQASTTVNSARVEADSVVHGGANDLKEFPA
jgi:signal-transduction protein with cAMP-binding, CBS, and nucleotidyltransferase domain